MTASDKPKSLMSIKDDANAGATLPAESQGAIGEQMKRLYGDLLAEPMPDSFLKLMQDLAGSERKK